MQQPNLQLVSLIHLKLISQQLLLFAGVLGEVVVVLFRHPDLLVVHPADLLEGTVDMSDLKGMVDMLLAGLLVQLLQVLWILVQ